MRLADTYPNVLSQVAEVPGVLLIIQPNQYLHGASGWAFSQEEVLGRFQGVSISEHRLPPPGWAKLTRHQRAQYANAINVILHPPPPPFPLSNALSQGLPGMTVALCIA